MHPGEVIPDKGMQAVKLLQQNNPVLHWRSWLTQDVLYNGCKNGNKTVLTLEVLEEFMINDSCDAAVYHFS